MEECSSGRSRPGELPGTCRLRTRGVPWIGMVSSPLAALIDVGSALELGPLAILALLYARRVRTLARSGHPVPGWRQACFYSGAVLIAAALTGLDTASQNLLYAHMVE